MAPDCWVQPFDCDPYPCLHQSFSGFLHSPTTTVEAVLGSSSDVSILHGEYNPQHIFHTTIVSSQPPALSFLSHDIRVASQKGLEMWEKMLDKLD